MLFIQRAGGFSSALCILLQLIPRFSVGKKSESYVKISGDNDLDLLIWNPESIT
jgi:hypothetical protein